MKVSVVTVCLNSEKSVSACMESYARQDYKNKEHIVVDGASTDQTIRTVLRYNPDFFVSERDNGLYYALNKGIEMATGDIICFLHSDDIFASNDVISKMVECIMQNNTDSAYADLEYVSKNDVNHVVRYWTAGDFSKKKLCFGWMPPHPTFFVKKKIYEQYGVFDTRFTIAADYDLMLRFLAKYSVSTAYCRQVAVKMRVGGASNKNLENIIKKSYEDILAAKRNGVGSIGTVFFKNIRKIGQFFCSKW